MTSPERLARRLPPAPGSVRRRVGMGRLAGLLLLGGTVLATLARGPLPGSPPAGPWLDPAWVVGLAVAAGVLCLMAPWQRLGGGWLHLLPPLGSALLAAAVSAQGDPGVLSPLYFVIAAFAAYAFRGRPAVAAHLGWACACLAAPLTYAAPADPQLAVATAVEAVTLLTVSGLMVVVRERMEAGQEALRELAQTDPLTGVGNYRRLYARLNYEIARHQRSGQRLALLVLDLDGFKAVNDSDGHLAGDRLLKEVAETLERTVRSQDTVARQGGDEFAVLAPETGAQAADALAARIEGALGAIDTRDVGVRASVGWALYPDDAEERMVLLECADARQRAVKRARRASGIGSARLSA